ncbi:SurA N-terminal domain-containing protein [Bacillus sp. FJAT-45350]|uniref:SurA N-terminal domain-containing protein n=1 Tax=Bacillus sp. FJAT-45350 TaxID=2011014 RepID=UPI000BB6CC49|nr:SurA N-terminal domain-containing protein [Bacillus sp. FJAT-45350]
MFKKVIMTITASALVVGLAACGGDEQGSEATEGTELETEEVVEVSGEANTDALPEVIATVNGEEIMKTNFEQQLEATKMQYQMQGYDFEEAEDGAEMLGMIQQQVVDNLITQTVLLQMVNDKGFEAEESEVDAELEQIMAQAQIGTKEELEMALEQDQLTLAEFREQLAAQVKVDKYFATISSEITVTEEEIEENYNAMKEMYEGEEEVPEFDELRAQIEDSLINERANQEISQLLEEIKAESDIEILI